MSKRYNQYQPRAQVHKKPKLEICYTNRNHLTSSKTVTEPAQNYVEDLWNDDDEEAIFLATQIAEEIVQNPQDIIANQHFGEITFSNFSRDLKTSTQIVGSGESIFKEFFDEDNDDAFNNIVEVIPDDEIAKKPERNQNGTSSGLFRVPQTNSIKRPEANATIRNDPKEIRQVNYLLTKVESLQKENEQLAKDVTDFTDKIQTKEGEVSMLRHEIVHIKQLNDTLRLEKMHQNEAVKKEWQEKIEELEKLLKAQQSEVEFKNIEISNLKTKKLNESQRFMDTTSNALEEKKSYKNLSALYHLHLSLELHQNLNLCYDIPDEIFTKPLVMNFSFRESVFQQHLELMQSVLAQLHPHEMLKSDLSKKILITCKAAVNELNRYIQDLEYPKFRDTNANVEYKFLCQDRQESVACVFHRQHISIFQADPLYPSEKAVIVRRVIAALALICKFLKPVWDGLFVEQIGENTLIQIIVEAINSIGYSKEIFSHTGLIESFGRLLNSSVYNCAEDKMFLSQYLRSLIFCRPDTRGLVEISRFLSNISSQWSNTFMLNSLCNKSNEGCFFINEYYKIFLYSPDSCPLQVYGALLEVALPQNKILSQNQADALTEICYNHIKFLRNAFEKMANWVLTSPSQTSCDCYAKVATSFVALFHLSLNQWICDPKSIGLKRISKISRVGSLVLCDIFHTNYRREVLQNGGSAIKHRLHIIYDWLNENNRLFRFKAPHLHALNSIKLLHIMADPLKNHEDLSQNEFRNDGNNIWTEVFVDFI